MEDFYEDKPPGSLNVPDNVERLHIGTQNLEVPKAEGAARHVRSDDNDLSMLSAVGKAITRGAAQVRDAAMSPLRSRVLHGTMEMKGPGTHAEPMRVDIKQSPQNSVAICAFTASLLGTPLQSTGQSSQASTVMVPHLHNGTATSVRLEGANDQQLAFRDPGLALKAEIQAQFQQHFQVIQQREWSFMQALSRQT